MCLLFLPFGPFFLSLLLLKEDPANGWQIISQPRIQISVCCLCFVCELSFAALSSLSTTRSNCMTLILTCTVALNRSRIKINERSFPKPPPPSVCVCLFPHPPLSEDRLYDFTRREQYKEPTNCQLHQPTDGIRHLSLSLSLSLASRLDSTNNRRHTPPTATTSSTDTESNRSTHTNIIISHVALNLKDTLQHGRLGPKADCRPHLDGLSRL